MTATEKLLKRLPKKYHCLVDRIEPEYGLIDGCKYMLYFAWNTSFAGYENVYGFPVKSITEAIELLKHDCEVIQ